MLPYLVCLHHSQLQSLKQEIFPQPTGSELIKGYKGTPTVNNCLTLAIYATSRIDPLNATQKSDFDSILQDRSMISLGAQINTIEQLCTFLENIAGVGTVEDAISIVQGLLGDVPGANLGTVSNITSCLDRVFL